MRTIQIIIVKLVSLLAIVAGAGIVALRLNETLLERFLNFFIEGRVWLDLGPFAGVLVLLLGLLALMPLSKPRRKRTISFPGHHGEVTIQLDSVESTLSRVVGKMPEVKKIWVKVIPSEDNHRAQVAAEVMMYKGAQAAGAREIANRICDYLADTAVNILGVEDVTTVNLTVRGIILDIPKPKTAPAPEPEPLAEPAPPLEPAAQVPPASDHSEEFPAPTQSLAFEALEDDDFSDGAPPDDEQPEDKPEDTIGA